MTSTNIHTQTITFTTMRVHMDVLNNYQVDNLEDHIKRLYETIGDLNMGNISKEQIDSSIKSYIKSLQDQNIYNNDDFCLVAHIKYQNNRLDFSHRPLRYTKIMYDQGFKLQISNIGIHSQSLAIKYKTNNYLDNKIQLSQLKKDVGEALRFNENNFLCEGCYSNVFIIDSQNNIKTPSLDNGLLSGIMRKKVIGYCKENNYSIEESYITKDDLKNAQSVFITNSLMGVMWINEILEINTYRKTPLLTILITHFQPNSVK